MARSPRWRVAILDDHERSRAALRGAIWAAGGEVVGEALRCTDALPLIKRASPDAAIFAVGLPDGDGIEAAAHVIGTADCPVVLFTSHTGDDFVERARAAGVMAYLLKPLRPAELAPTLDVAIARFKENRQLRQTLEGRKVIVRAAATLRRPKGSHRPPGGMKGTPAHPRKETPCPLGHVVSSSGARSSPAPGSPPGSAFPRS